MVQYFLMAFLGVNLALTSTPLFASDYQSILKSYAEIQKALASDKADQAKKEAAQLLNLAKESTDTFKKRIQENAELLTKTATDSDLRTAFGKLSEVAVEMIRKTEALKSQWQLMYCPMVPKGTFGFWIQPSGESLQNPYYGAKMLTCGVKRPW